MAKKKKKQQETESTEPRIVGKLGANGEIAPFESARVLGRIDEEGNKTPYIQAQKEDIAPVKQTGFFNANAKENKVGNTLVDIGGNILKGGLSAFEGLADFGRYRAADVMDIFGANNKAKELRTTAKANTTEEIATSINHILSGDLAGKVNENDLAAFQDIQKNSLIGDKGDQVFQGVGNSATNAALSALGGNVGGMTSLFMSAAGNAQSEAYQEGATDFQAGIYGALSGSVEAATEMMFGGLGKITQNLGFGTGALDDQLINRFTRKLSNTIAKNAVDLGLRSAGEGVEEVVAGFGNAILQKLIYMQDEDFSKLLKDQKLMDSFVSGALSSALMQAPTTLNATMQGRESSTGFTENEREVYNRELENRLKAEEKLTNRRRSQIEEQLNQDFERGYVNAQNIRDILGDRIDLQKDTRLAESFNEETRRTQAYENDISKYDEKQAKVIQTAIDSGLLNNSNKTHDMVDLIAKLSADKGVDFDFTNNERIKDSGFAIDGRQVNGFVKDGTVNLNLESNQVLNKTVGHEITHVLEGTELYDNLQQSLKAYIGEKEWNNRISQLEKVYQNVKGANIQNELTSDLVGEHIFNDENFIRNLSTKNPNLFQKIFDEIKYMVKIATAGSKEARDLEKVKRAFEKAYRESSKTQQGTQYQLDNQDNLIDVTNETTGYENVSNKLLGFSSSIAEQKGFNETKYPYTLDLQISVDGGKTYFEDSIKGMNRKQAIERAKRNWGKDAILKETSKTQEGIQYSINQLTDDGITMTYVRNPNSNASQYKNINQDFGQDLEPSGEYMSMDTMEGKNKIDGYEYGTIQFKNPLVIDNEDTTSNGWKKDLSNMYNGLTGKELSNAIMQDGYDAVMSRDNKGNIVEVVNLNGTKQNNQNTKYSLTEDSQGRELSKEQQEFFKDSKVRDDEGNLMVMNHATADNTFTVFEKNTQGKNSAKYFKQKGGLGEGFYFSDEEMAYKMWNNYVEQETQKPVKSMKVYLDIKNPYYVTDTEISKDIKSYINDKGINPPKMKTNRDALYFANLNNINIQNMLKELGYDGIIERDTNNIYQAVAFESNQIKNVDNTNPTSNPDIRYSLSEAPKQDNQGRELTLQQQEFFKDSKVRDEDGRLLELYHGSKARDVNIFEYSPERQTGTDYGEAYYFTSDYNKAKGYQYDANLDERVANHEAEHQRRMDKLREANFSEEARKEFLEWSEQNKIQDILNDEDYIIENVDNISGETKKVYLNLTNPLIVDANGEYYYNVYPSYFEEAREKGNDGIIVKNVIDNPRGEARPIDTYIAFKNNQFKNVDNTNPTSNPDIRYSLSNDEMQDLIKKEERRFNGFTVEQLDKEIGYAISSRDEMTKLSNELTKEYKELQKTDEFMKALQNYDFDSEVMQKANEYADKIRYYDNQRDKYQAQYEAINNLLMGEQKDTRTNQQIIEEAQKHFGTTDNFKEAGYITTDGNMLDFSGFHEGGQKGQRSLDHRQINEIDTDMDSFIGMGNIRILPEGGGINLEVEPTAQQYSKLRDYIDYVNDEVYIDVDKPNGTYDSARYKKGTSATKIINDIKTYFETGSFPQQSEYADFYYSLQRNNEVAPTSGWEVRSEDVRLQSAFKDAIAPIQEQVQQLTDTMNRLEERIAPVEETTENSKYPMIDKINDFLWKLQGKKDKYYGLLKPDFITEIANEERQQRIDAINNLIDNLSKKIADSNNELNINDVKDQLTTEINNYIDEYRPLTEQEGEQLAEEFANRDVSNELAPVSENLTEKENQRLAVLDLLERNNMLDEEHQYERDQLLEKANPTIPNEEATPGKALEDIRDEDEVGKRSVKAYQYEHPEVKPYFQQEARGMLSDLEASQKGERFMFESPKQGQGTNWEVLGIKRFTSPEIADLLDSKWGYTYKDIEKGLKAIIEDHGAENIAVAKRIEFILDDNLRNGYTDWQTGMEIPPNQDYLNMLAEQEWNEYYDNIQEQYPLEPYTPVEENVPDYYSIEDEDVSDMKIDKDLQDMTVDDINLEPFLEGLQKASDRQAEREQLRNELNQKKEVKIPKETNGRKAWNKFKSLFVNEFAVVDDYAKRHNAPEIKHKTDTWNNYLAAAQYNIENAQTDMNGKAIGRSGNSIFQEAQKLGLKDTFDTYLKHWANVDRAKQGKGANYEAQESYKIVKEMEAKNPELKRLGKDMWQYYRNARHNLRDAGIINQQTSDLLGRMYPHYTPYISENIENYFTPTGELKPKSTIKRAKGGAVLEGLLSAEEAMQMYTKSQFNTIFGNDVFRSIVNTSNNQVEMVDNRTSYVNADNLYTDKDGYYLTAYENGDAITAKISEEMYKALSRESKTRVQDLENTFRPVGKVLSTLSNIRRNILTSWSPTFIAKNFIKDYQEALFNSKYTADFAKNYPSAFKELATNTGEAQQFKALYGSGLTMGQFDMDSINYNPNAKNFNFLKGIKNANELIELAPRYAEFKASRENGASIQEAMYNAREVTTNFSRGGVITKAFNKYGMTFLNSSVQGFDKFVRNFSGENGAKGVVNSLAKAVIFGIAPAVFNELAFGSGDDKDEEYEAIPDYIKDNYYIIKTGDGNFIRIPKGRVFSVFGSAARRTIEMMEGEENAFDGFLENAQQQIGINNPEENNIFAPFIQAMGGRKLDSGQTAGSAWYGGDIIPSRLQKERPEDQYDASIDKFSIWLGQQTGISPYKINYVLDQYSGGIGDLILPMITDEANSDGSIIAPIKDQFTADSTTDNKYVSEFYDTKGKLYTGSKATDEDKLKNMYMNHISMEMSQLYAERREVQASDLPKKEKYAKSQEIKKEINRLAKIGLDGYNNLEVTGNYAVINDDMSYYKNANGEWKPIPQNDITYTEGQGLTDNEKSAYYGLKNDIYMINKEYEDESLNASTEEKRILNAQKKNEIIDTIKSSKLDDNTKAYIYSKKYGDKKIQSFVNSGIDVNSYLDYKQQDFSADKDRNGKSISGSKKRKVFDYINSMNIPYEQKLILAKSEYNSFNQNNYDIINYIENSGMSYDERIELYKNLGFKVDGDSISW